MVFVLGSVYVMDSVYRFIYVEPALYPWDEADFIVMDKLLDVLLDSVCQCFTKDFASMFIMYIGLTFSFLAVSLPDFHIRMILVS